MQGEYYTVFTKIGQAKIANAIALGQTMQFKYMGIGDGDGAAYEPNENQTELRREVYRAQVSSVTVSDANINQIRVSMMVPADVGGFFIREVGHYDAEGNLLAVTKTPEDPKPTLETGAAKDMQYNIDIIVSNTAAIELKVDPTVIIATKAELTTAKSEMQGYADNAAATATQAAKDYADQQDAATDAKIDTHTNSAVVHITADERAAWDAKATQADLQQLAASSVVHYKGFSEVTAGYTAATPLADVLKAMVDNSILFAVVEAANDDYPVAGNLQVIRYTDGRADCQLRSTDADGKPTLWIANFTPAEIEQIFGGGGVLNKWVKVALGADSQIMDALQGIVRYPCSDDISPGDPVGITSENEVVKIDDYAVIEEPEFEPTISKEILVDNSATFVTTQMRQYIELTNKVGVMVYFIKATGGEGATLCICTISLTADNAKVVEKRELATYTVSTYFCSGLINMDGTHIAVFCDDNLVVCTINGTAITAIKVLNNPWTGARSTEFAVKRINSTQILACFCDYADSFKRKAIVFTFTSDFQSVSKGEKVTLTDGNYNMLSLVEVDSTHYQFLYSNNGIKTVYLTLNNTSIVTTTANISVNAAVSAHKSIGNGKCVLLRSNGEILLTVLNADGMSYQYVGMAKVFETVTSIAAKESSIYSTDNSNFSCMFVATINGASGLYCCTFHIAGNKIVIDREATKVADYTWAELMVNLGNYFIIGQSQKLYYVIFNGIPGTMKCLGIAIKTENGIASIVSKGTSKVNIIKEIGYKVPGLGTYLTESTIEIESITTRWA